jgi:Domain of unknown function (DUF4265)
VKQKIKILFVYKDDDDEYQKEGLWGIPHGEYFKIVNIPFLISNIAWGDIVSVELEDGEWFFDELIESSGHSTIQIAIFDQKNVLPSGDKFIALGCSWEGSHLPRLISVDIPKELDYVKIKKELMDGLEAGVWEFREASLGDRHRYNVY